MTSSSNILRNFIKRRISDCYPQDFSVAFYSKARFALLDALKVYGQLNELKVGLTLPMCAGVISELKKNGVTIYYFDCDTDFSPILKERESGLREIDVFILTNYFGRLGSISSALHEVPLVFNYSHCYSWPILLQDTKHIVFSLQYNKFLRGAGGGLMLYKGKPQAEVKVSFSISKFVKDVIYFITILLCKLHPLIFLEIKKLSLRSLPTMTRAHQDQISFLQLLTFYFISNKISINKKKNHIRKNLQLLTDKKTNDPLLLSTHLSLYTNEKNTFVKSCAQKGIEAYDWPTFKASPKEELIPSKIEIEIPDLPGQSKIVSEHVAIRIDHKLSRPQINFIKESLEKKKVRLILDNSN